MKLGYTFFLSNANLMRRKLRSFLTIGGMAVGISLVVFLVSLGFGLQRLIVSQIANVEALTILDVSKGESTLLKLDKTVVDSFKSMEDVEDVSPSLSLSGQVTYNESVTDTAIYGINPQFLAMEGIKVNYGTTFASSLAQEMVITSTALNLIGLGAPEEAVGTTIKLKMLVPNKVSEDSSDEELVAKEVNMKIVGVLVDDQELSLAYVPLDFLIELGYTPDYSVAKVKVDEQQKEDFSVAKVKVTDESKLPEVRRQIEALGYQVDSVADTVGQIDKIFVIFEIVVAAFGAIALFVAAIGSLNTLTVSLLERTREIGLMKTLGATSGDILRLFLVEAVLIGMIGGLIGIGLGMGAGEVANFAINYMAGRLGGQPVDIFYTPFIFIAVIVVVVLFVSIVTGLYPARRAGHINALDALRYE
ncbi:MAG: ABC transporter permease [Patescibacteria group bacterium]|nr:ABC transporter permease [Patescibacteria group bacterium]